MSFDLKAGDDGAKTGSTAPFDGGTRIDLDGSGLTVQKQSRRRVIQGAAAAAAVAGAVYLKPSFRSFGVPVALAGSAGTCGSLIPYGSYGCSGPLEAASDCCQVNTSNPGVPVICKNFGAPGGNICCDAGSVCI